MLWGTNVRKRHARERMDGQEAQRVRREVGEHNAGRALQAAQHGVRHADRTAVVGERAQRRRLPAGGLQMSYEIGEHKDGGYAYRLEVNGLITTGWGRRAAAD